MHTNVVENITPDKAQEMLSTMVKNRPVSDARVLEYAIAMEQGEWSLNGETIKVDRQGRVFDGQHRLRACILAERAFRTYVVRGVEDDHAFATVDVGKNRSHSDVFSIAGFSDSANMASITMVVYLYKNNLLDWKGPKQRPSTRRSKSTAISQKIARMPNLDAVVSKEDLLRFAEGTSDKLVAAQRFARNCKATRFMSRGIVGGLYFAFYEKSPECADQFFELLGEGLGLTKDSPLYWLREKMIANASSTTKLTRWMIIGYSFKVWNKWRAGERMKQLRVIADEEFPRRLL